MLSKLLKSAIITALVNWVVAEVKDYQRFKQEQKRWGESD